MKVYEQDTTTHAEFMTACQAGYDELLSHAPGYDVLTPFEPFCTRTDGAMSWHAYAHVGPTVYSAVINDKSQA